MIEFSGVSQFEYVIVLMSFIVAFGASEILSGWGRQYLDRSEARPFPLQLAVSVLLLGALLQTVWGYWGFRAVHWNFGSFLLALLPLLPLVGAAGIVLPPAGATDRAEPRAHYFSVCRAIFLLMAAWVALGTLAEFALVEATLHVGQAVRLAAVAMLIALSFSSNEKVHWGGLVLLTALQVSFIRAVTPALG